MAGRHASRVSSSLTRSRKRDASQAKIIRPACNKKIDSLQRIG
jgi:hypothetical protein